MQALSVARWRALVPALLVAAAVVLAWLLSLQDYQADLRVFYEAGNAVLQGESPYPAVGTPAVYSEHAFVYPIAAVVPFLPLALLPWGLAKLVFFALSVVAVILALRLIGVRGALPFIAVFLSSSFIRSGQLGTLNALLLAGALVAWHYRDSVAPLVGVLTAVIVPKLFLAPLLGWPLVTRRWKATAVTVIAVAAVLGIGFVVGPLSVTDYAQMMGELSDKLAHKGWGGYRLLLDITGSHQVAQFGTWLGAAAVLGVSLAWYLRYRAEVILFTGAIVAAIIASPIVWTHYYLLAMAPLLVAGVRARWLVAFAVGNWVFSPPPGTGTVAKVLLAPYNSNTPRAVGLLAVLLAVWVLMLTTTRREALAEVATPARAPAEVQPQM